MAKNREKPKVPFMKAYIFIHKDKELSPAEKLVLNVIGRFWPNPCWKTNKSIAELCGFSERYIERLLRRLKKGKYILVSYVHNNIKDNPKTKRLIIINAKDLPYEKRWIQPDRMPE